MRLILTKAKKRLHYKKLGETGEQSEEQLKSEEEVDRDTIGEVSKLSNLLKGSSKNNMLQEKINILSIEESTIPDDTRDLIDENQVEDMLDAWEIDNKISKWEVRPGYRSMYKELKVLDWMLCQDLHCKIVEETLMLVKQYFIGFTSLF